MPPFTPQDLRRTCGTHIVSIGFPQLLVGKILNHTDESITAIYNQHSYDLEKQKALEAWEKKLNQIISGAITDNIVSINAN